MLSVLTYISAFTLFFFFCISFNFDETLLKELLSLSPHFLFLLNIYI